MRQLIIARKDLNMSVGKLAAQVSHASMAFISHMILDGGTLTCIGFRPLLDDVAHAISKKYQLFR